MSNDSLSNKAGISKGTRVLALIPARGGSKGLPRKNVLLAGGKPLVAWTVDAAISAECVDRVVLSSEDNEIINAARAAGCDVPFIRPLHLASDIATSIDVVLHALDQLPGYEYVVLLQPTSPLRTAADIDSAFELMLKMSAPSCVSVCEADQSPYWMYHLSNDSKLHELISSNNLKLNRRQDLPPVYILNGAIYIARIEWLRRTKSFLNSETIAFKMPNARSLDIDNSDDFALFLMKLNEKEESNFIVKLN